MFTINEFLKHPKVYNDAAEVVGPIFGSESIAIVDGASDWLRHIRNKFRIGEYTRRAPRVQAVVHPLGHKVTVWIRDYDEINLKTVIIDFYERKRKDTFLFVVKYAIGSNPDSWSEDEPDPDDSILNKRVKVLPATAACHKIIRFRQGDIIDMGAILMSLHRKCLRESVAAQ